MTKKKPARVLRLAQLLGLAPMASKPKPASISPNAARRAAGLPEYSGPAPSTDPGIYARNLRAFTLEILHTEVAMLRRRATSSAARDAFQKVQDILEHHTRANIMEGQSTARAKSYRDPDLSDQWLAEAEHRAKWDDSRRFTTYESRQLIHRLVAEVRRLNRMLGR